MGCGGSTPADGDKADTTDRTTSAEKLGLLVPMTNDSADQDKGPLTGDALKARIIGSKQAQTHELGEKSGNISLRFAALSQRGYYPEDLYKANQDRFLVAAGFDNKPNQILLGVFDGHGVEGDMAADFVKRHMIEEFVKTCSKDKYKYDLKRAYLQTFVQLDTLMHSDEGFDDSYSGSTAITCFIRNSEMYVANIGDSRAILGERRGKRVLAYSLSVDQTPYRKDERERVKACGARVMTMAMAKGEKRYYDGWEEKDGALDGTSDPPRVFAKDSLQPGNAFTRSLGDAMSSKIGIVAEAELLKKDLREQDQFIVLASDGVWEFLTNQSVCSTVMDFTDPVEACRSIIAQSYGLWLQFEVRTDDITIILAYIDFPEEAGGKAPRKASDEEIAQYEASLAMGRRASQGTAEGLDLGLSVVGGGGESRPVRRGLSEEKKKEMGMSANDEEEEEKEQGEWQMVVVNKSDEEIKRIKSALKGNFLFQNLPETQTKQIYDVMKRKKIKKGELVIRQGDKGEEFYVLDQGELAVTINNNGMDVEIMRYRPNPAGANPCFGELALMYSKPRAATVKALSEGVLWAIDRRSFREILKKSSTKYLMRTLRNVEVLKSLSVGQLQRLSELLTEKTYKPGEKVIVQGEEGDTFYIIAEGRAKVTKKMPSGMIKEVGEIFEGQYFGERALLKQEPRAANVVAAEGEQELRCLYISKSAFEEVLGPLQKLIDDDATWRYKVALVKQLKKNAAGLGNAQIEDFHIHGVVSSVPPVQYILAQHRNKEYTLRVQSKKQVTEMGLKARLRNEMKLLTRLHGHRRFVPLALQTMEDDSYIYGIYSTRVACLLSHLLEESEQGFDEPTCIFYASCIITGLEHLHSEAPSSGGVMYRNLVPEAIIIDEQGYPQLIDMRYASGAEPQPRDYCGYAHYLAPEQVSGLGHGLPVDLWALGCLIYEMLTTSNPWLTGDPGKDSEISVYAKISGHTSGALQFPADLHVSVNMAKLLNELIEPSPEERLGVRDNGYKDLRAHPAFDEVLWGDLANGTVVAPHGAECTGYVGDIVSSNSDLRQSTVRDVFLDEVYEGEDDFSGVTETVDIGKTKNKNIAQTIMEAAGNKRRQKTLEAKKAARQERQNKLLNFGKADKRTSEAEHQAVTAENKNRSTLRFDYDVEKKEDAEPLSLDQLSAPRRASGGGSSDEAVDETSATKKPTEPAPTSADAVLEKPATEGGLQDFLSRLSTAGK